MIYIISLIPCFLYTYYMFYVHVVFYVMVNNKKTRVFPNIIISSTS